MLDRKASGKMFLTTKPPENKISSNLSSDPMV
jgi:hypothetical protein